MGPDSQQILSALGVGVVVQDMDSSLRYGNDAACRLLGMSREQLLGRTSLDPSWAAIHPDGTPFPGHEHPGPVVLRTGQPVVNVVMGVWRPIVQDRVWLLITAVPHRDPSGQLVGSVISFSDITGERELQAMLRDRAALLERAVADRTAELTLTVSRLRLENAERERTRMALAESEELYRAVLRAMAEGVAIHEQDGSVRFANPSASRALGLTHDQLMGRSPMDERWGLVSEDGEPLDGDQVPSEVTRRTGRPVSRYLLGVNRPDGERRWLSVSTDPVFVADDTTPRAVVATFTDVSPIRQANEDLERSRERFQRITDAVPGVILQVRAASGRWRITYASARSAEMLGIEPSELVEDPTRLTAKVHPDDRSLLQAIFLGPVVDQAVEHELLVGSEEGWRTLRLRVVAQADGAAIDWHGVLVDVTEERRLADSLRRAQRLEAMTSLAAGVAHNFNNMLAAIVPNLELATERANDDVRPLIDDARRAASGASALVAQLLLAVRGEVQVHRGSVDLVVVTRDVLAMCRSTFEPSVRFLIDLGDRPAFVRGSESLLNQVVLNLCINARDAMDGVEDPRLQIRIAHTTDGFVELSVIDNGSGMSRATLTRLGEPFFTTKEPGRGTGLGIATARGILADLGGELRVQSELGQGSTFTIRMQSSSVEGTSATPTPTALPNLGRRRVLIVDDERLVRTAMRRTLERMGLEVLEAEDGMQGLERLSDDIGAVLLDLSMPGMSGSEVLLEIRRRQPDLPVAILTGHAGDLPGLHLADTVLLKPVDRAVLAGFLASALGEAGHDASTTGDG